MANGNGEPNNGQPKGVNTSYFHSSPDPIRSTPGQGYVTEKDLQGSREYIGEYPTLLYDRSLMLADAQGWWKQFDRAGSQMYKKTLREVVSQAANIVDVKSWGGNGKGWFAPDVNAWKKRRNAVTEAQHPIFKYSDDPFVTHPLNDSGFWYQNYADLSSSIMAFFMTGAGVTKLTKIPKAGKIFRSGSVLQNFFTKTETGRKLALATQAATTSYALTHAEGLGIAFDVYDNSYKDYITKNPDQVEDARKYASERAATAYDFNRINFLLNLTSSYRFLKPGGWLTGTRNIIAKPSIARSIKHGFMEGAQEYLEETVNYIAENRAMSNKGYTIADVVRDVSSAEGISNGILGFIGGIGQMAVTTGGSNLIERAKNQMDGKGFVTNKTLQYNQQQEILKNFAQLTQGGRIKDLTSFYESSAKINELMADAQEAYDRGDMATYEAAASKIVSEQAYKAFQSGTTEKLIGIYDEIGKMPNERLLSEGFEQQELDTVRQRAAKAIDTITKLEKAYSKATMYNNAQDVYYNRANDVLLNGYKNDLNIELQNNADDVRTAIQDAIEAGVITNTKFNDVEFAYDPTNITKTPYEESFGGASREDYLRAYSKFIDEAGRVPEVSRAIELSLIKEQLNKAIKNNNKNYYDLTSAATQSELGKQIEMANSLAKLRKIDNDDDYQRKVEKLKVKYAGKIPNAIINDITSTAEEARREHAKREKNTLRSFINGVIKRNHQQNADRDNQQREQQPTTEQPTTTRREQPLLFPIDEEEQVSSPERVATTTNQTEETPAVSPTVVENPVGTRTPEVVETQEEHDTIIQEESDAWQAFASSLAASDEANPEHIVVNGDVLLAPSTDFTTQNLSFFSKAIDAISDRLGREPTFQEIVQSFIDSVGMEPFKRYNRTIALLYVHRSPDATETLADLERIINEAVRKEKIETSEEFGEHSLELDEETIKTVKTHDQILEFDRSGNIRIVNDAVETAFDKVAYLSANYDKIVIQAENITEVQRETIQSGDNPIVVNTETPGALEYLTAPVGWSKQLKFRKVAEADNVLVTKDHQADTIEKIPFSSLHLNPGTSEYNARVPIEIVDEETGTVYGYVHDVFWIDTHNIAESQHDTISQQRDTLLRLRTAILASPDGITATVKKTSLGKSGRLTQPVSVNIANPSGNLKFVGVTANGELRVSNTETISPDEVLGGESYVSRMAIDNVGRIFEIRPIPVQPNGAKYIMLPVTYSNVTEDAARSIARAIEAYLLPNDPENAKIVKGIQEATKMDITSPEGLENYITLFINTQGGIATGGNFRQVYAAAKSQAEQLGTKLDDGTGVTKIIPASLPFIGIQHGSVVFGQINRLTPDGEEFFHAHPNAYQQATTDDKNHLRANLQSLSKSLLEKKYNYQFSHADVNPLVPIIDKEDNVTATERYIDHIGKRTLTNVPTFKVPAPGGTEYVTFIQPIVRIQTPEVSNVTLAEEVEVPSTIPPPSPTSENADDALNTLESEYGTDEYGDDLLFSRTMEDTETNAINNRLAERRINGLSNTQQSHVVDYMFNMMAELIAESRTTDQGTKWRKRTGRVDFDLVLKQINSTFDNIMLNKLSKARLTLNDAQKKLAQGDKSYQKVVMKLTSIITALETINNPENKAKLIANAVDKLGLYMDIKLRYNKKEGSVDQYILGRDNILRKAEEGEYDVVPNVQEEQDVIEQTDDNTEDFSEEELTNERTYSKSALEMDQKASITTRFRRFLSGIKAKTVNEYGNVTEAKGFLGLPVYVPFDIAFNTLSGVIAKSNPTPDLSSMIETLKENSKAIPWLESVAERLESNDLDQQIKNEFVVTMMKHAMNMKFVMYSRTKKGMVLRLYDTNASATERLIYNDWLVNFKISNLSRVDQNTGDYLLDKEEARRLLGVFDSWKSGFEAPLMLDKGIARQITNKVKIDGRTIVPSDVLEQSTKTRLDKVLESDKRVGMTVNNTTYIISKQSYGGQEVYDVYEYTQSYPTISEMRSFLSDFNITLSDRTLYAIENGEMTHRHKKISFGNQFYESANSTGIFGALAHYLRSSIAGDADVNISHQNPLEQGIFYSLASLEARFNNRLIPNSVITGDKTIYPYTATKYVTDRVEDILKNRFNVMEQLMDSPFSSSSLWLNAMNSNEEYKGERTGDLVMDMFSVSHLDINALKEHGKPSYRNAEIDTLPDADHELVKIGAYQDTHQYGTEVKINGKTYIAATFFMPTMSDKGSMILLRVPTLKIDTNHFKRNDATDNLEIGDELVDHVYEQSVLPELKRMVHFYASVGQTDIEGYDLGAKLFNFFPTLNTMSVSYGNGSANILTVIEESAKNGMNVSEILNTYPDMVRAMKDVVGKTIAEKTTEKIAKWKSSGLIVNTEKGVILPFFDSEYMSKFGSKPIDELIFMSAADFVIGNMVANANSFMTIIGDPALYTKTGKDFAQKFADAGKRTVLTKEDYTRASMNTFVNVGKRLASMIAPGNKMAESTNETYTQLFMGDRSSPSVEIEYLSTVLDDAKFDMAAYEAMDDAAKKDYVKAFPKTMAYLNIEGTDAQEYTTWQEHLHILEKMAKTPGYAHDITLEEIADVRSMMASKDSLTALSPRQLVAFKKVFQPLKPVYTGQHYDSRAKVMRFVYIKTSSIPLLPQVVAGTELEKLERLMQSKGIQRATYGTGVKVGFTKNPMKMWNKDGRITIPSGDLPTMQMYRRNFRIQQDKPYKGEKNHINLGTQESKVLFADILNINFTHDGEDMTGEQLYDRYNNAYHTLFRMRRDALMERLGLERDAEVGSLIPKDAVKTMQVLQEILLEEAESRGYGDHDIEGLEIGPDGKFVMPIWTHVNAARYEALLVSIINNKIVKTKMPGGSMVVGSEEGLINTVSQMPSGEVNVSEFTGLSNTSTRNFRLAFKDDKMVQYSNVPLDNKDYKIVQFHSVEHAYQVLKSGEFDQETHAAYVNWAKSNSFNVDGKVITGRKPADVATAKELMSYLVAQSFIQNPNNAATQTLIDSGNGTINYDVSGDDRNAYMPELLGNARRIAQSRAYKRQKFEEYRSRIVWTSKWEGKLRGSRLSEDGKTVLPQQVLMPSRLRDENGKLINLMQQDENGEYIYLKIDGDRLFLNEDKFDPDTLKLFGFRIPTSGKISLHSSEVVGFLPEEAGDLIIESRDLITQTGQDFDIDMKYFYQYNMRLEDGKLTVDNSDEQKKAENEIIRIHHTIFSDPNKLVQKHIVAPLSMDVAKKQADDIENLSNVGDKEFTPLSDEYQKEKLISASHGKTGVGAYSLDVVFHASTQIAAKKGKPIAIRLPVVEWGKEGNPFITWVVPELAMGKHVSNGNIGRSNTLDGKRSITEVLAERQNIMTDAEKVQVANRINLNRTTMDADKAMTLLGWDLDTFTQDDEEFEVGLREYFLSQPILRKYVEYSTNAESSVADFNTDARQAVLNRLVEEFGGDAMYESLAHIIRSDSSPTASFDADSQNTMRAELSQIGKSLSGQNLYNALKGTYTGDMNKFQQGVLVRFIMLTEMGLQLRDVETTINADSKGIGKSMIGALARMERIGELVDKKNPYSMIKNASYLLGDVKEINTDESRAELVAQGYIPMFNVAVKPNGIQGYATIYGLEMLSQLFMNQDESRLNMFPYLDPEFRSVIGQVISLTAAGERGEVTTSKRSSLYEAITKDMRKYINSVIAKKNAEEGLFVERFKLFMDIEGKNTSLASYLNSLPNTIKQSNALLRMLKYDINKNGKQPSLITYNNSAGANFDESHIYNSFYELLGNTNTLPDFNGKPYSYQKLAQDLITYAMLEGGIQEAIQFSKYVPMGYIKNSGIASFLNTPFSFASLFGFDMNTGKPSEFAVQYFQHNPQRAVRYMNEFKMLTPIKDHIGRTIGYTLSNEFKQSDKRGDLNRNGDFPTFISTYGNGQFQLFMRDGNLKTTGRYVRIPLLGTPKAGASEYNAYTRYSNNKKFNQSFVAENNPPSVLPLVEQNVVTPTVVERPVDTKSAFDDALFKNKTLADSAEDKVMIAKMAKALGATPTKVYKMTSEEFSNIMNWPSGVPDLYAQFLFNSIGQLSGGKFVYLMEGMDNSGMDGIHFPNGNTGFPEHAVRAWLNGDKSKLLLVAHEAIHQYTSEEIDKYFDRRTGNLKVQYDSLPEHIKNLYDVFLEARRNEEVIANSQIYKGLSPYKQKLMHYHLSNIHEFVTGSLTEPDFIKVLATIPQTNKLSLLDRFIKAISQLFTNLLEGKGIDVSNTLAESAMSYSYQFILATQAGEQVETETTEQQQTEQIVEPKKTLFKNSDRRLEIGSVISKDGRYYLIANIDHANKGDVRVIIGNGRVLMPYDKIASMSNDVIGMFPVVEYNNNTFVVTDNAVYSTTTGKPVNYSGVELERIRQKAEEPVKQEAPKEMKTSYGSTFNTLPVNAVVAMKYKDGDGGRSMRPEHRGKSTMDLILEGKRTATTRRKIPQVIDYEKGGKRNIREGDVIEFTDYNGRVALVEVTSEAYPITRVSAAQWSKLEGWDESLYNDLLAKHVDDNYQFTFRLLDYKNQKVSQYQNDLQEEPMPEVVVPQDLPTEEPVLGEGQFTFSDGITIKTAFQLTQGQQEALQQMADFIDSKDFSIDAISYSLRGFAGTGKTSIVRYLLDYIKQKYARGRWLSVKFAAPTHKAAKVLNRAMAEDARNDVITTAKILAKIKKGIGANAQWISVGKKHMPESGLLIVDESSMISPQDTEELLQLAEENRTKIIFMGDPAQLPSPSSSSKSISPALLQKNQYELTEVKRQEKGNPLFTVFDAVRNNIASKSDVFNHTTAINEKGEGIEFTSDQKKFSERVVEMFKHFRENPSYVKFTAYTNSAVAQWNNYIRRHILEDAGLADFQKGEILMGYEQVGETNIANGQDYVITSSDYNDSLIMRTIPRLAGGNYNLTTAVYALRVVEADEMDTRDKRLNILDLKNPKNDAVKQYLYALAKEYHSVKDWKERKYLQEAIEEVYSFFQVPSNLIAFEGKVLSEKELMQERPDLFKRDPSSGFAPIDILERAGRATRFAKTIDYGYAITVHKVQGSTYDNIIIDMDSIDIPVTNKEIYNKDGSVYGVERNMLKYVALSRPRNVAVVFSKHAKAAPKVSEEAKPIAQEGKDHIVVNNDSLFAKNFNTNLSLEHINQISGVDANVKYELPSSVFKFKKSLSAEDRATFERMVRQGFIKPKCS